eukprot:14890-Eustigmatos_ZCMA.PRE.1
MRRHSCSRSGSKNSLTASLRISLRNRIHALCTLRSIPGAGSGLGWYTDSSISTSTLSVSRAPNRCGGEM